MLDSIMIIEFDIVTVYIPWPLKSKFHRLINRPYDISCRTSQLSVGMAIMMIMSLDRLGHVCSVHMSNFIMICEYVNTSKAEPDRFGVNNELNTRVPSDREKK